ncbi:hypothetical protein [Archaeoglobus profundus]|uniref:Uncharacterized protein n=1 Tax=Archaeoglobus profundus (strain DSM 5631 / JCM 9629 / NBRC 100127 / Av18) TaxID=572546 RepID=D2RHA8_ARCPA|nr:hypothetical protein [Archaeoglobus profundus]ADB57683.1 hypothetical protein Arcpr_0618 [Archaeoglobus profundus DSM 5631]
MEFGRIIVHNKVHGTEQIKLAPPGGARVRHYIFRIYYDDGSVEKSPTFSVGPVGPGGEMKYVHGLIDVEGVILPADIKDDPIHLEYYDEKLKRAKYIIRVNKINRFEIGGWTPSKLSTRQKGIKIIELIEYDTALVEV